MALRTLTMFVVASMIVGFSGFVLAQDQDDESDPVILRIALADAPTTLQRGMAVSEQHGKPISAKFEMPSGDLQLSVYTAITDGFVETVLDPKTGTVLSVKPIADAEDLADARAQKAAMDKATASLIAAADKAVNQNAGSRAVSIMPELQNGEAVAKVKLQRPKDLVTVLEPLN
jgi:hypothetical protein